MGTKEVIHSGMADASSAIAIGNDRFLVVSDEDNQFYLYPADKDGGELKRIQFSSFIDIDSDSDEADVEGSATIGDITYWIGSHSRDSKGNLALSRHQLFATLIRDRGEHVQVKQVGSSYSGLLFDLMAKTDFWKYTSETLKAKPDESLEPKAPGAVSIEGLTARKNSLLIGFRNPVPSELALLVPLENPLEVVLFGEHGRFGDFIQLDLGGRGIRSIDFWKERNLYFIVAGSFDQRDDFAYYTWTGKKKDLPQLIKLKGAEGLNTEAIVFFEGDATSFLALSDDGKRFKKKKPDDRSKLSFRSRRITLK